MNIRQKRGLSGVVTTLIIILLVLVALGITWVTIRNILKEGTSDLSLEQLTLSLDIRDAYVDGELVRVNVRRDSGGGDLSGIKFIFDNGEETFESDISVDMGELEARAFIFTSAEVGGIDIVETVSVAALYMVGNNEEVGNILEVWTRS
jgi:flagellin-like protein